VILTPRIVLVLGAVIVVLIRRILSVDGIAFPGFLPSFLGGLLRLLGLASKRVL
jgi:hypothetical protein